MYFFGLMTADRLRVAGLDGLQQIDDLLCSFHEQQHGAGATR